MDVDVALFDHFATSFSNRAGDRTSGGQGKIDSWVAAGTHRDQCAGVEVAEVDAGNVVVDFVHESENVSSANGVATGDQRSGRVGPVTLNAGVRRELAVGRRDGHGPGGYRIAGRLVGNGARDRSPVSWQDVENHLSDVELSRRARIVYPDVDESHSLYGHWRRRSTEHAVRVQGEPEIRQVARVV